VVGFGERENIWLCEILQEKFALTKKNILDQ
jgi:hypothetical protein